MSAEHWLEHSAASGEHFFRRTHSGIHAYNAAVQRPRDQLSGATHVQNEMAHVRRARADVSRSAATACYAALPTNPVSSRSYTSTPEAATYPATLDASPTLGSRCTTKPDS